LKIAWLTPWSAQSAIARSAASVATELEKRGHEVTVLRTETGSALELPPLPASRDVHALAHWSAHDIRRQFDVAVAHVGDHFGFHGALLPKLNELSFIGIFHDAFLADLAYVWLDGNEEALRAIVAQTYGGTAWPPGEAFMHDLGAVMQQRPCSNGWRAMQWPAWLMRSTTRIGSGIHARVRLPSFPWPSSTKVSLRFRPHGAA
jgi:hypothetical protein